MAKNKGKCANIKKMELSIMSIKKIADKTKTPTKELMICALNQGFFLFGICKIETINEAKLTAIFCSETIRGIYV